MKKIAGSHCGRRVLPVLIAAVLTVVGQPSSGQLEPSSTLRETTTVTVIEVPVIVLRDGTPVHDLVIEDFLLLQDGVEQQITSFERVDLSVSRGVQGNSAKQPTSLAGRRYFLLAFDLSHTQPANARRAVLAARNLVEGGLQPTDLVGVSVYGAVAGARLLHPFTSDKSQLEAALLAVEAVAGRDPDVIERAREILVVQEGAAVENLARFLEEIRVFATQQGVGLESTVGPAGEWLVGFDSSGLGAVMAETLAEMEEFHQENTLHITRDRSLELLETLSELASALGEVRGQKHFVLFSEGIDLSLVGDYAYVLGMKRYPSTEGTKRLAEVLKSFRRSGWVVQAVNVTRATNISRGMFFLAEETGGREYRNFSRLDQAMGEMLERTSVSYVLSFQPEDMALDGSYHEIEVRLKRPAGTRVSHRDGFFAPSAAEQEGDFLVAEADRVASEEEGGPLAVAAIAAPFRNTVDTWRVMTTVEISGPSLLVDRQADLLPIEIDSYLVDEAAGAIPLSTRRVNLDVASQGDLISGGGIKVIEEFLLGPGDHRLRFAITERASGRRSLVTVPVTVPDHPPMGPQLLAPFFPELSRNWLVVRESEDRGDPSKVSPFQFGGRQFVPRAAVFLTAEETVPVVLMARHMPEGAEDLQVSLRAEDSSQPKEDALRWIGEPERTESGLVRAMAELDTAGLAAGRYEIRVHAPGEAEDPTDFASRWVEIR